MRPVEREIHHFSSVVCCSGEVYAIIDPLMTIRSAAVLATIIFFVHALTGSAQPADVACAAEKIAEIIAPARSASDTVIVNCSAKLPANQTVTKRVVLGPEASGTTFDCRGSTLSNRWSINVTSRYDMATGTIRKARDITVKNCTVTGTFQISTGVSADFVLMSSRTANHTQLMRSIAPTNIMLDAIALNAAAGVNNGIYFALGTTDVTLRNSTLKGVLSGVPLYLDAESGGHTIVNNTFDVDTTYREQIAIDGSSDNVVRGNRINARGAFGGIQIYRNCGEGQMIRHNDPRRNRIEGNTFVNFTGKGNVPGVWLGSRNAKGSSWCGDDAGYSFGSSANDADFARDSMVRDNTFEGFTEANAVRNDDTNNLVTGNRIRSARGSAQRDRSR